MAALIAAAIATMMLLNGCQCAVQEACFEANINPTRGTAIIFDKCRGQVFYQNIPALPEPKASL